MAEGEQEDDSQKTEDPTPKKIEESRKKGQVAMSREINNWVMLFTGTIVVLAIGPAVMSNLTAFMKNFIEKAHTIPSIPGGFSFILGDTFWEVMGILTLPLVILVVAAIVGSR